MSEEFRIPTVKIKSDKGRLPYRIINESDFDEKKHELFGAEKQADKTEKKAGKKQAE